MSERTLRQHLEQAVPYYGMDADIPKRELEDKTNAASQASLVAHAALYQAFRERDPRVGKMDGDKRYEWDMYITFDDERGLPCYFAWDENNPATDIGLRGANPNYLATVNPTTIIHADSEATQDFVERNAPIELIDAIDAVAGLNRFIVDEIARPYLHRIAEAFKLDPETYANIFLPHDRRARTLTRVILYHLNARPLQHPVGADGAELLIKEHNDKSSFTIDAQQSSPGLQYRVNGEWHNTDTRIACFRGTADDYLPKRAPPTLHRAVYRPELRQTPPLELASRGIARVAIPTFISPSTQNARITHAGSAETHPTEPVRG